MDCRDPSAPLARAKDDLRSLGLAGLSGLDEAEAAPIELRLTGLGRALVAKASRSPYRSDMRPCVW